MNRVKNWLRNKLIQFIGLDVAVAQFEKQLESQDKSFREHIFVLHRDLTTIGADISFRHDNTVITNRIKVKWRSN